MSAWIRSSVADSAMAVWIRSSLAARRASCFSTRAMSLRASRSSAGEAVLHDEMAQHLSDHEKLALLSGELTSLAAEKETLESEWLEASELLS